MSLVFSVSQALPPWLVMDYWISGSPDQINKLADMYTACIRKDVIPKYLEGSLR